jgi:hypothetical protein
LEKHRETNKSIHCDPKSATVFQEHCSFFGHCSLYVINELGSQTGSTSIVYCKRIWQTPWKELLSVTRPNIFCKVVLQSQNVYWAMSKGRRVLLNIMHYPQKPIESYQRSVLQKVSILRQYICCQAIKFYFGSTYYKVRARST